MNLLHLDSSILGAMSVSRQLSRSVVERLSAIAPDLVVSYRDLEADPVPHLSGAVLMAARAPDADTPVAVAADVEVGSTVMREFLAADVIVIGVGFYNFGMPSQLKAWIDRVLIAGVTFRYGEDGRPIGLAGGKRVVLAIARGGFYGPGQPAAPYEHCESHLRAALGFIGITDVSVVAAEGIATGPDQRAQALATAQAAIAGLT